MDLPRAICCFAALAQETRFNVIRFLIQSGGEGVVAGAIAKEANVPPSTLSFHLKELVAAGLISSQRNGRQMIYRPDHEGLQQLLDFFAENCFQQKPMIVHKGPERSGADARAIG